MDGAQSVHRAILILRILATAPDHRLSDISKASGLSPPTTRRLLQTLIEEGFVVQDPHSGRYEIGNQLAAISMGRPFQVPLVSRADPLMKHLARTIGDTTFLTIVDRNDSLCIARYIGSYPIQVITVDVGTRRPLGASSAGLAILSNLSEEAATAILERNKLRLAGYKVDLAQARERLGQARVKGYAINDPALSIGAKSLSVPIPPTEATPAAALTVLGIRRRLAKERMPDLLRLLKGAAAEISQSLVQG